MSAIARYEGPLPRRIDAPGCARMLLTERFGTQLVGRELDTAKLLTSELVATAVLHGLGAISFRVDLDENRVLVEVVDEGTGFARVTPDEALSELGGWGLRLVDSESSRWGIREGSSHVWFELDRGISCDNRHSPQSGSMRSQVSCASGVQTPPFPLPA